MIKTFINRPILSTVISIILVLLGILGLQSLPVTQYPDIAPPTVNIRTSYIGANAETVQKSVIVPIEEQVNGVEGMDYITSTASNDGSATINVFFKQGIDPDIAAVNVQNRVARATPLLPAEVNRAGVVTQKQQTGALMYLSFYSTNKDLNDVFLQNYLDINIIPGIKRIFGIGDASVFGGKTYAMRIWLDPQKMAIYGIQPNDVTTAINSQSLEAATGALGQNSGSSFEYIIKYKGKLNEQSEYENIIIKSLGQGNFLRLKDIATIQLAALSYTGLGESSGNPALSVGVFQTPGSNAQDIIRNVKKYIQEQVPNFPKGVSYTINYDTNDFLTASIDKVVETLLEAFLLVFIVVFIFLQDFRSTLIPAIAVPVSLIGTFFFLNLFGYSLNLLTLFALVLAIGIVVDDAIVVVEVVHAKLDLGEKNATIATEKGMKEITGAIISITLVMAAVFIPVTFITGPTGIFYQQFGITLIIAIIISAINALSLSPALCALFLKPHKDSKHSKLTLSQRFFLAFNTAFKVFTKRYGQGFVFLLRHKWISALLILVSVALIFVFNNTMPKGFVPTEDRGIIFTNVELPASATMDRTYQVMKELASKASKVPGVVNVTFSVGRGLISGTGSNYGLAFMKLAPFEERSKEKGQSADEIIKKLFGISASIADAKTIFFGPASVPGFGNSAGFQVSLLNKSGAPITELDQTAQGFIGELMKRPEIQFAQTSFNTKYPQYQMDINVARASEAGVPINSLFTTMQGYIGGIYAADFTKYGKQYRVMVQALPQDRIDVNSLNSIFVRTGNGQMAPISQFITLQRVYGPPSVNRFNLFSSVDITGASNQGFSTGDAIKAVQEVAQASLSTNYSVDFSGLSREEIRAGAQAMTIFALSLVFVYFILAGMYESYILPLSVILSLPLGVMGAYLGQWLFGLENNIYFQIALIMLVGLLAKNAILIVEFAVQRRRHGETIAMAAINAAKARLRPILMTSFAFIFGMLPLVFATGIGALGNQSIATGAAFGLLVGTILGLFVIPVLFAMFQWIQEKIKPIQLQKSLEHEN
ncbi:MAG: efflux RND transporter permease subunit [Chitinophagaceae bacterium]|nr:efflux RND transporter permease subunit [Chitinophagaceae bacterium]MCW5905773.1 efflux RND transporter permease subunit [Chitinophagaceae bacterium]